MSRDNSPCPILVLHSYGLASFYYVWVCTVRAKDWTHNYYAINCTNLCFIPLVYIPIMLQMKKWLRVGSSDEIQYHRTWKKRGSFKKTYKKRDFYISGTYKEKRPRECNTRITYWNKEKHRKPQGTDVCLCDRRLKEGWSIVKYFFE